MPFFDPIRIGASGAAEDFTVERSLRFNDNDQAYLGRTPSSASNRKTWTLSFWFKRGHIAVGDSNKIANLFCSAGNNDATFFDARIRDSDKLMIGINSQILIQTNQVFRDPSAWYHMVVSFDTTQASASNRLKLYINGSEVTSFGIDVRSSYVTQDGDFGINSTTELVFGKHGGGYNYFDGYMAEINFIDGQQYDASYFGETDALTGQWNPKKYGGGYGTNGFYLNFSDNSGTTATTLGKDSSGNSNNFTPNNFSVSAGAGNDSLEDTPTNNFSTINPLAGYQSTFYVPANGNLDFSLANSEFAFSTFEIPTSGKWYVEILFTTFASGRCGITNLATKNANKWHGIDHMGGAIRVDDSAVQSGLSPTIGNNKIVGIKVDRDAGTIAFTVDGSDSGTAVNISSMSSPENLVFAVGRNSSGGSAPAGSMNFGQRSFSYLPTGYQSLCSANLPDLTILDSTKHFGTLIYEGNSSTQVITDTNDVDFTSDWVWVKRRDGSNSHLLFDSVRGVQKWLTSSQTTAEGTNAAFLTAFNNGGFTSGNNGDMNVTSRNYVAWNWNAGDTDGKTYTVTVVDDSGNKFRFDGFGTSAVTLDLAEGGTYIFNYPSGHPFRFSTTADGTHGGGSEYTTGVTHNSSTQVTIVVAASAPTLYYYCSSHSGMGGAINTNTTLGSSNFDGSVQSICKVNAEAGFSITRYTGTGGNITVGHGLGVTPQVNLTKKLTGTSNWTFLHTVYDGSYDRLYLNTSAAYANSSITAPTSTVFSRTSSDANNSGMICYSFSSVEGYSKIGYYVGNGNDSGTFVFCNFRPTFIMIKGRTGTRNWFIMDTKRDTFNLTENALLPNTNNAETTSTSYNLDILSNGFKLRKNNTQSNQSGIVYIFMAYAESPFKNARAR